MSIGPTEFYALALDLRRASVSAATPLREVFDEVGAATAKEWAAIATVTAGRHGKHYPKSITHETRSTLLGNVESEIGPDKTKPQGGMGRGFELGSKNQPPHLDGVKAFDRVAPLAERLAAAAISKVIP